MVAPRLHLFAAALTATFVAACGSTGGRSGGTPAAVCGDGKVEELETCDDGNTTPGDGCSATCQTETGYVCSTPGSACLKTAAVCGDGVIQFPETCDDGNTTPGDGCSETCQVERGFGCPAAGAPCQPMAPVCGDGVVAWPETCDDGNTTPGDGCSSSCQIERGFVCPTQGKPCQRMTPVCGDGIATAPETCDDGNRASGDGCSSACQVEDGWACGPLGGGCHRTVCGDDLVEGKEECDDGNNLPFDGCDATCHKEVCTGTACTGFCGDGILENGEECDDGNTLNGDGCSADCKYENIPGVTCDLMTSALPSTITVPVIFRDFKGVDEVSASAGVPRCAEGYGPFGSQLASGCGHPDFEAFWCEGPSLGLVNADLGPTPGRSVGVPVYNAATAGASSVGCEKQLTSPGYFAQWYTDVPGVNRAVVGAITLNRQADDTYLIDQSAYTGGFFPIDGASCGAGQGCGWGISHRSHDYGFTSEVRYAFTYGGGEKLTFAGDDDVWIFINGKLAVDLGGLHPQTNPASTAYASAITLDDATATRFGLVKGNIYEMALFHAERHTEQSNFTLTLGKFVKRTTVCKSTCGDGVAAPDEECDLGARNGQTGSACSSTCKWVRDR